MAGAKGSKQRHRKHGLVALRPAIQGSIDAHSKLGLALAGLRNALLTDLGVSSDTASESQRAVVELAVRTQLRWASTEAWLDKHLNDNPEALLDQRILAIVREGRAAGQALAGHLLALRDPRLTRQAAARSWDQQLADVMAQLAHDQEQQDADEAAVQPQGRAPEPEVIPGEGSNGHEEPTP